MGVCFLKDKKDKIGGEIEKSQEGSSFIFPKDDDDDTEFKLSTILILS